MTMVEESIDFNEGDDFVYFSSVTKKVEKQFTV